MSSKKSERLHESKGNGRQLYSELSGPKVRLANWALADLRHVLNKVEAPQERQ